MYNLKLHLDNEKVSIKTNSRNIPEHQLQENLFIELITANEV